jgi:predicted dehydrogenase
VRLRAALLGYGLAGAVFHAPLIAATPGLELAAVATSHRGRQRDARRRYPDAAVVSRPEQVWERAAELDLVVVATPNRTHVPLAGAALSAGLPVVVDKPLATSAAGARSLVEAATERDLLLTVFHNRRWDGDFLTLKQLVADGTLGSVHRFESRFERWRPAVSAGWRELPGADEGGGVLYDLGSHLIDQAVQLFGEVDNVYAEIDRRRPGAEVDDDVFCALTHASGVRSHLWASSIAADRGPRMRVLGSRAAYVKHGLDVQEAQLRDGPTPGQPGWGEEPEDAWGVVETDGERRPVPTRRGAYEEFYGALVAALRRRRPPPVDPSDAVAVVEVIEAARDYAAR